MTEAGFVFDMHGRKPMFYLSLTGMMVALGMLAGNFFFAAPGSEGGCDGGGLGGDEGGAESER